MRASSRGKKNGLAKCATTQLDLFDHSVCDHTVTAGSFCTHHAPKARCMMIETANKVRKTYSQNWPTYTKSQVNEKAKLLELLYALCEGVEDPPQHMGRPRVPMA